ncbi:hypothetical protein [Arthrobacter sp. Z1-15]
MSFRWRWPERFERDESMGVVLEPHVDEVPAVLATRIRDLEWSAEVTLEITSARVRFAVRIDDEHWYGLTVDTAEVEVALRIGPATGHQSPAPA